MTSSTPPRHIPKSKADLRSPFSSSAVNLYEAINLRRGTFVALARTAALLLSDIAMLTLAWLLSKLFSFSRADIWIERSQYVDLGPILLIVLGVMAARGLYKPGSQWQDLLGLIKAIGFSTALSSIVLYSYQPDSISAQISYGQILCFLGFSLLLLSTGRISISLAVRLLRARGAGRHPVFLICEPDERSRALQAVEGERHYLVTGTADANALDLSNRDGTMAMLKDMEVDEVFVSWQAIRKRLFLCWRFQTAGITLQILPASLEPLFWQPAVWMMGGIPTLKFAPPLFAGINFWLKRYIDFLGALIILFILSPIYLFIALAIRLDSPGPIFYKQTRVGLQGKEFKAWKFRSMVVNADSLQTDLERYNETKDGILFKIKNDPRITRVGKFLRQYSLDELPQIFNILLGEMSLVGPRPLPLRDVEKFSKSHFIRHEVLPGITGLWQVSGRSDVMNFDQVIQLDLMYIENWSLWLDFKILLKTIEVVLKKTGAY